MSRRKWITLLAVLTLVAPLMFYGCSGDDGATGATGPQGLPGQDGQDGQDLTAALKLESCAICHDDQNVRDGNAHQADYDQRFQDNVVAVVPGSITYAFNVGAVDNTHIVKFQLTKNGANFNCTEIKTGAPADSLSIGFAEYNAATRSFDPPAPIPSGGRMSLGSQTTLTYDNATNVCTSTVFDNTAVSGVKYPVGDLSAKNGIIEINGRDDRQGTLASPSRVQLALFPFAGLSKTAGVNYVSAANVQGCEKCHTVPYLKHGFIYGRVDKKPETDFYTCKGCHSDNARPGDAPAGGHFIWQALVDDPRLIITLENQYGADWEESEDPRLAPYAYKTSLKNDVHMSHAMEFAYPQSMANCVTCHQGKLASTLTDNNFTVETCKSCHPETDASYADKDYSDPKRAPALANILPQNLSVHSAPFTGACNLCHSASGVAPVFSAIHTGYDKVIYGNDNGTKYSTAITVTIDNASFVDNTNTLTFGFHATGSLGGASSANIVPTVLVGLYGFDTKDYIAGPHERSIDDNGDGVIDNKDKRDLEAVAGIAHPRITITSPAAGTWVATANLSNWAPLIAADNVTRVEIGVIPTLRNPAIATTDNIVALDAPSKTFNLNTKLIEDYIPPPGNNPPPPPAGHANNFFGNSIVRVPGGTVSGVVSGCNNCHEALATTFHTPDRGGNIVICRLCHITKAAGSHLELQSRSIDSYAHAIHRFQAFDTGRIDFTDPVEVMEYTHHVQSNFPTFGIENCRACHNAGKFNVPNQGLSLPGVLSNTDFGTIRNIAKIDNDVITGPATRACGACHRAEAIIANAGFGDPIKLANINSHMTTFGYMIKTPPATILDVINQIFASFGGGTGTILPAP